jgi:hypothetical protein
MDRQNLNGKPYFVVTVDTEADDAWERTDRIGLTNLLEIPRFQELCNQYHVVPTYLVTYECATRDEALSVLKPISDSGHCEIGHHLHVWTTPPFEKEGPSGVDLPWLQAYQFELPDTLFQEKAECLREAIETAYGKSPTSHRAGRWGIDQRTVDWMIDHEFMVDSSVVPMMNWSRHKGKTKGGPSFVATRADPHAWPSGALHRKGRSFLVEIPVSIYIPGGFLEKLCAHYLRRQWPGGTWARRVYRKLIGCDGVLWTAPDDPPETPVRIMEAAIRHGMPVLNLMLHSSELALACSPFSRTPEDSAKVWRRLETVFQYVNAMALETITLSQMANLMARDMKL